MAVKLADLFADLNATKQFRRSYPSMPTSGLICERDGHSDNDHRVSDRHGSCRLDGVGAASRSTNDVASVSADEVDTSAPAHSEEGRGAGLGLQLSINGSRCTECAANRCGASGSVSRPDGSVGVM